PAMLMSVQRPLAASLAWAGSLDARLAVGSLGRALRRNAVTIGAMMIGLAMLVSVSTMIHSFRKTVEVWIEQTIRADLYLSHVGRVVRGADARLPAAILEQVRQVPGVALADGYRTLRMEDGQGDHFVLGAGDFEIMAGRGRLLVRRGDSSQILTQAKARDQVLVSETFAERYHLNEGDEVALRSPDGTARLRIAGVYYDYTTEGGLVVMDRALFAKLWRDPWINSAIIYLAPGADPETVRRAILARLPGRDDLMILSNRALKARVLEIFDQTFAITYGLEAIALVVAVLGVLNSLLASVLERTREIGILRSVGFTRGGIVRSILWEAGLMGALANLLGALTGLALSLILIYVINKQSFGWTIQLAVPARLIAEYALLTMGAALIAGFFPAWRASRVAIAEAVRYE
ncbi:MAG TPA: ABC transporter permease, partial [Candidatus Methylomirabilis sp.]